MKSSHWDHGIAVEKEFNGNEDGHATQKMELLHQSPKQVFNANESALFWKKNDTKYISKEKKWAPGFKEGRDSQLYCFVQV